MKRMFVRTMGYMLAAVLIPLIVLLVANFSARNAAPEAAAAPWYEITGDVLTVRLPVDETVEEWIFGVSDEDLLELVTCEYPEGENLYAASFRNFSGGSGEVVLTLHGLNGNGEVVRTENLALTAAPDRLSVEE